MKFNLYNSNYEIIASIDTALDIDSATDELITENLEAPGTDIEFDCVSDHITIITIDDKNFAVAAEGVNIAAYDF